MMARDANKLGLVLATSGISEDSSPLVLRCVGTHGACQSVILVWPLELGRLAALERVLNRENWTIGVGLAQLPGQLDKVRCLNPICPTCHARILAGPLGNSASPSAHGTAPAGPRSSVTLTRRGG
jgi:hypothetical protein